MANENLARLIVDGRGQAILIAAYVENGKFTNCVGVWIGSADVAETGPPRSLRDTFEALNSSRERLGLPVRMGIESYLGSHIRRR